MLNNLRTITLKVQFSVSPSQAAEFLQNLDIEKKQYRYVDIEKTVIALCCHQEVRSGRLFKVVETKQYHLLNCAGKRREILQTKL